MKKTIIACLMLTPLIGICQQVTLDLSNDKLSKQFVSPGTKQIVLTNVLSTKIYKITAVYTDVSQTLPAPFKTADFGQNGAKSTTNLKNDAICTGGRALADKINDITNANSMNSETEIKNKLDEVKSAVSNLKDPCKKEAQGLLDEAIKATTVTKFLEGIKLCQVIYLTIERYDQDDRKKATTLEKVWVDTIQSTCPERPNKWLIYYGFTYQPNILSKYDNYFAKKMPGTDSFAITKLNGDQSKFWENVSPTVMCTYMLGNKYQDIKFGISGIAATNFSTFSAGLGMSLIVGYNFNIGAGVMFTQKNVLNGMYKEGDTITENLSFDQLHTKKWGPEMFFSIGFRFDKNPFSKASNSGSDKTAGAADTKPDAADDKTKKTTKPKDDKTAPPAETPKPKETAPKPKDNKAATPAEAPKPKEDVVPKTNTRTKDKEEEPEG